MKKILLPFIGHSYPGELLDFVKELNQRCKLFLTAAFIPDTDYAQLWPPGVAAGAKMYLPPTEEEEKVITRNRKRVGSFCETHEIRCRVREDHFDFALSEIKKESRFADLLMISSHHFFDNISNRQPNSYMSATLHDAECPVMLLPDQPHLPGEIVLAYDGTAASVHAIRQFDYLFPEFANIRTTLVYIDQQEKGGIPEEAMIRELGAAHFRNFRMLHLKMNTDQFYTTWIGMMSDPWLVAGAFGRSEFSTLLSHSFIHKMIREHNALLFVAHQ